MNTSAFTFNETTHRPTTEIRGKYNITNSLDNEFNVCYIDKVSLTGNMWQITNPFTKSLPTFMLQLSAVIFLTRIFIIILKPFRQPRFICEILAGLFMGPSALGMLTWTNNINPFEGAWFLETMGNLGVTFYMFLVGLQMDVVTPIQNMGKTAWSVAIAGTIIPAFGGMGLYYLAMDHDPYKLPVMGGLFWAAALTVTSFPDLARILSDLKLMYTDIGKTALTSAVVTDITSWFLLVFLVSVVNGGQNFYTVIATLLFIPISWFVTRPILCKLVFSRIEKNNDESSSLEGKYSERQVVCCILSGILFYGFVTEVCGIHSMFGGFMFGLMIPSGELGAKIADKIEEYVVGILMPPVFLLTGLRTNVKFIFAGVSHWVVILVILVASSIKIVSTLFVCLCLKCSIRDSLALGVLMNTKGILAIIVLNEGRNVKDFDQQTYTWMILSILFMTGLVGPMLSVTHKSTRYLKGNYYRKNFENSKVDAELRVLACVHSNRNLSGLINLLGISNATPKTSVTVFAVHLVELTGRASAMLIFHDRSKSKTKTKTNANTNIAAATGNDTKSSREKAEADQIFGAFVSLQNKNSAIILQLLTAVSSYATMHQDINNFALDKGVTAILIPFHKKPNHFGRWTEENLQHKQVMENLLANSPCPIGILVDRGLTSPFPLGLESQPGHRMQKCRIIVLFLHGPDYREALAYAWRMAGTPGVILTVVRFISGKDHHDHQFEDHENSSSDSSGVGDYGDDSEIFSAMFEKEKQKLLDDDYVNQFRFRTMHDKSITYIEKQVNSGDQIVSMIRSTYNNFDLYIVGRGHGMQSPLIEGLSDWNNCPELGLIGETLGSAEFLPLASVLVMQQSAPTPTEYSKNKNSKKGGAIRNRRHSSTGPFVNHRKADHQYY